MTCKDPVFQSDLRIFRSDSNKTISAMATQAAFENTCLTIFTKMINSVPKGTQLSNPIVPRQWITIESHLDLSPAGVVQYSGQIGAYNRANGQLPATANYYYGTQGSGNTGYLKAQLGGEHWIPLPRHEILLTLSRPDRFQRQRCRCGHLRKRKVLQIQ